MITRMCLPKFTGLVLDASFLPAVTVQTDHRSQREPVARFWLLSFGMVRWEV